jgi:hypothetical protein
MCPFSINKPELCRAALSSLMIDDRECFGEAYNRCPIFFVNQSGKQYNCLEDESIHHMKLRDLDQDMRLR